MVRETSSAYEKKIGMKSGAAQAAPLLTALVRWVVEHDMLGNARIAHQLGGGSGGIPLRNILDFRPSDIVSSAILV